MAKKRSRLILTLGAVALVGGAMAFAFWPRPVSVDMGSVTRGEMIVTIDEEGRTRVSDAYVLSTPIAGRLMRVDATPGDPVVGGETVVAQMKATNPSVLDVRTREQAQAAVSAAEASLRVARADMNKALADKDLASENLERTKKLVASNTMSKAALDLKTNEFRSADARLDSAEAAISMREAELNNARAQLIGFDDIGLGRAIGDGYGGQIPLVSPATGRVLRVIQQSETTLPAGAPVMEIGNIDNDLEVVVELLSGDAVQVNEGDRVFIRDWGGPDALEGVVERIDPWGFTKVSALGVEEQRVNTIIKFADDPSKHEALGHGFRVEVQIIVWENKDAVIVPSNALFRDGEAWAVFVVEKGVAKQKRVEIGRNNGTQTEVLEGLSERDTIILYPSSGLEDGTSVTRRAFG